MTGDVIVRVICTGRLVSPKSSADDVCCGASGLMCGDDANATDGFFSGEGLAMASADADDAAMDESLSDASDRALLGGRG